MTIKEVLHNAMMENLEDQRVYDMCEAIRFYVEDESKHVYDFEDKLDFAYREENYNDVMNKLYYEV